MNIQAELTKKVGPLPLGAWALIIGGGIGVVVLLRRRGSTDVQQIEVNPDSVVQIQHTTPGVIPQAIPVYQDSGSAPSPSATPGSIEPPKTQPVQTTPPAVKDGGFGYNPPNKTDKVNTPQTPPTPPTPPKAEPRSPSYPGLPVGFVLDCAASYKGLHGTYAQVYADQKRKNQNDTFTKRNMMAIAIQGTPTPWVNRGDWNNPAAINNRRVRFGLYPLTNEELERLFAEIKSYSQQAAGNEFNFLSHTEQLFNSYNYPYQCTASNTIRKTR